MRRFSCFVLRPKPRPNKWQTETTEESLTQISCGVICGTRRVSIKNLWSWLSTTFKLELSAESFLSREPQWCQLPGQPTKIHHPHCTACQQVLDPPQSRFSRCCPSHTNHVKCCELTPLINTDARCTRQSPSALPCTCKLWIHEF